MTPFQCRLNSSRRSLNGRWWIAIAILILAAPAAPAEDDPYDRYEPALAAARAAVREGRIVRGKMAGSGQSEEATQDLPSQGAVLVGFELGLGRFVNEEVIYSVRPLFWSRS